MMLTWASRCKRKYGSRCSMLTRLRLSSMPQLPPRAAMRTPLTLMTRSVPGQPPSTVRIDGEVSAFRSSDCTQVYRLYSGSCWPAGNRFGVLSSIWRMSLWVSLINGNSESCVRLDANHQRYSEQISEIDLTDPEDA